MPTKGELLRFSLAYALSKIRFTPKRVKLSDEARYAAADDTIRELRRFGEWKELDQEAEVKHTWLRNHHSSDKPTEG